MYIKMTEFQKYCLISKENDSQNGVSTTHYVELLYNGQLRAFEQAFNKVIASQPMLRAKVSDNKIFFIEDDLNYRIKRIEYKDIEQSQIELKRKEISNKKYKISSYPFFTMEVIVGDGNSRIFFSIDQLIMDDLCLSELMQQIKSHLSNSVMSIHNYSNELLDMQNFYQEKRCSESYKKVRDYYIDNLENIYVAPQMNYQTEQSSNVEFLSKECTIPSELYKQLKIKADQLSCSVTSILFTMYSLILSNWSKERELSININYFNRPKDEKYHKTLGNFTSSYLLQTSFDFEKNFKENIQNIELSLAHAFRHRDFETVEILREMNRKSVFATMPVVFSSRLNERVVELDDDEFKLGIYVSSNPQAYLDFLIKESGGELNISWKYRNDIFESTIIDTMFSEYCSLLFEFLNATRDVVDRYNLTKKSNLILKYEKYNAQAYKSNSKFDTLRTQLEKTTTEYPEKVFVVMNNKEYTFKQIYTLATQKAMEIQRIKKIHQKGKARIVFNGRKTIDSITCILAAILTNDSFFVINEGFGEEKTEEILLTLQNYIYFKDGEIVKVSDKNDAIDEEESYIIHTSGTTGEPKGIIITEKAVLNTVYDIIKKFKITQNDTIMNISNLYFDLSIFDIFGAIISGMSIAFVDAYEYSWFFDCNYYKKITIWNSTPALAKEFLLKYRFEKLKGVLVSGDFVPKKMVEELFSQYDRIQLFALGGATEVSIWSNFFDCSAYKNVLSIPYGIPLANQCLYIVDSKGNLCDSRVLGEICIAGKGLAKGYLSDKQTKESFVWNEYLEEMIYKTGDLGYLGTDNLVYIVGRVTSEIKHNGYRIDLREIEKYINKQAEVSNSVAFIEKAQNGRTKLTCAIVCGNKRDVKRQIRSELSKKLPLYMIPNRILLVSEIPLTRNGKVDIKLLNNSS